MEVYTYIFFVPRRELAKKMCVVWHTQLKKSMQPSHMPNTQWSGYVIHANFRESVMLGS